MFPYSTKVNLSFSEEDGEEKKSKFSIAKTKDLWGSPTGRTKFPLVGQIFGVSFSAQPTFVV